jgi:hypothetical protein
MSSRTPLKGAALVAVLGVSVSTGVESVILGRKAERSREWAGSAHSVYRAENSRVIADSLTVSGLRATGSNRNEQHGLLAGNISSGKTRQ